MVYKEVVADFASRHLLYIYYTNKPRCSSFFPLASCLILKRLQNLGSSKNQAVPSALNEM